MTGSQKRVLSHIRTHAQRTHRTEPQKKKKRKVQTSDLATTHMAVYTTTVRVFGWSQRGTKDPTCNTEARQHSRVTNKVFNTNLSATTAGDLHATKIVNVRRRDCADSHLKRKLCNSCLWRVHFETGSEQESSATQKPWGLATQHVSNTLPDMFFLTIKHRISPNHRPTLR